MLLQAQIQSTGIDGLFSFYFDGPMTPLWIGGHTRALKSTILQSNKRVDTSNVSTTSHSAGEPTTMLDVGKERNYHLPTTSTSSTNPHKVLLEKAKDLLPNSVVKHKVKMTQINAHKVLLMVALAAGIKLNTAARGSAIASSHKHKTRREWD